MKKQVVFMMIGMAILFSGCQQERNTREEDKISVYEFMDPDQIILEQYGNKREIDQSEEVYEKILQEIQTNWGLNPLGEKPESPIYFLMALDGEVPFCEYPAVVYCKYETPRIDYKGKSYDSLAFFPLGSPEGEEVEFFAFGLGEDYWHRTLYYYHYTEEFGNIINDI
ncbi:hypothetical protein [Hominifimenecus sp. rT4P-3]|uniref:hypothetical protein n=1 Tax=Hominifimenecus sp. rT4P-3 TaxID=3242979 RepID=UPI003DA64FA8